MANQDRITVQQKASLLPFRCYERDVSLRDAVHFRSEQLLNFICKNKHSWQLKSTIYSYSLWRWTSQISIGIQK